MLRCLSTLPSRMPSRKIWKQNKTSEAILLNQKKIWNNTASKGQSNESKKPSDILMVISICFGSKCVIQGIFKLHKGTSKLFLFHWFRNEKKPQTPKKYKDLKKNLDVKNGDFPNK